MHSNKLAIIRADASTAVGIGHVMRMLALTQALIKHDWQVHFCFHDCPEALVKRFTEIGATTRALPYDEQQAEACAELASKLKASVVILDGYQFNENFMDTLATCKAKVLVMDDYQHAKKYNADFIVNQNFGAESLKYNTASSDTKLLLGGDFILLRQEFIEARSRSTNTRSEAGLHVVITLGGSDAENVSQTVLHAIANTLGKSKTEIRKVSLVCGGVNPNLEALKEQIGHLEKKYAGICRFNMLINVTDMATLLSSSDLVISAGGGTVWEAACLGRPNIVIVTAENQLGVARFANAGAILLIGSQHVLDLTELSNKIIAFINSDEFALMPAKSRKLIDGNGASRIVSAIEGNI